MSSGMSERTTPMQQAIFLAHQAAAAGEVPVGAVIMDAQGVHVSAAHNLVETRQDPTAHAEMLAIKEACRLRGSKFLTDCDLYVTLEPCAMCAQAIALARVRRVYYGASDPKGGGVAHGARVFTQSTCHHHPEIYEGIDETQCSELLQHFFRARR